MDAWYDNRTMRRFFVFCFGLVALVAPAFLEAQVSPTAVANRREELQRQLNDIESQIATQQQLLDQAQGQRKTLQSELNALDAQIKKTQLQIQVINITIAQLSENIGEHNETLASLSAKLSLEKESLAQILRKTQMIDDYSVVTVALGSGDISDFFGDLDAFVSLKSSLADSFAEIRRTSATTEVAKDVLEDRRAEQQTLRTAAQLAKQAVQAQEAAKKKLLEQTKGVEANYQKLLSSSQKTAAQIRTELFQLAGGAGQISLPNAIALAQQAGAATGVRPAFILAVLRQETNLGANVGQCLLTNVPSKGDGKGKNSGTLFRGVMKGTRDVDPFMTITSALGLDPYAMPVSCPQAGGYGGAMGPSQFIPSTWVLYQARVAKLAKHPGVYANPWDNLDAFTATALYMADLGAGKQTFTAERTAALRYFAGSNWSKPANAFYGDSVMRYADDFQKQIEILTGS